MLFIARFLDYHVLKRFAPYLFIMALISVVAVIFLEPRVMVQKDGYILAL